MNCVDNYPSVLAVITAVFPCSLLLIVLIDLDIVRSIFFDSTRIIIYKLELYTSIININMRGNQSNMDFQDFLI